MPAVRTVVLTLIAVALSAPLSRLPACPFCSAPDLTLSERLAQADAAVLGEWRRGEKGEQGALGSTAYRVLRIVKDPADQFDKNRELVLNRYRPGKAGTLFLLTGTLSSGSTIQWDDPLQVTETSFQYIVEAPSPESPRQKRLEYFLKFLEYPDPVIAKDAYAEFAKAPYKDVVPLTDRLPRAKIRKWLTSSETPPNRIGLYGLMLGLCGNAKDVQLLKEIITEPADGYRQGIDGVIGGYLLLTGEDGLDLIDRTKLENTEIPFSETYAAMQSLRFLWTYAEGAIDKERLRASMRLLLDRPELADLVIADLARWKDWSVQDRLMDLYGTEGYNVPSVKRAIVRYMLVSTKDAPENGAEEPPEHVVRGKKYLETLRKRDPKLVRQTERFLFLN